MRQVSIIVSTLDEESRIENTLLSLKSNFPDVELIVVDGRSKDRTVEIASKIAICYQSQPGRGKQMNLGAAMSTRPILWFVHADCYPDPDSIRAMKNALGDDKIVGGGFQYSYSDDCWYFGFIAWFSNLKNKARSRVFGDMGIFVRRNIFERMGGFTEDYLMEDFDFGLRLKKAGKIAILSPRIVTSVRHWRRDGIVRKIIKDSLIKTAYRLGVNSAQLYKYYYRGVHEFVE